AGPERPQGPEADVRNAEMEDSRSAEAEDVRSAGAEDVRSAGASAPAKTPHAVFDQRAALACTGGDRQLLGEIIELFRRDCPSMLANIVAAIRAGSAEDLRKSAHALKGALANVGGEAARNAAAELEDMGRAASLDGAPAVLARLEDRLLALDRVLVSEGLASPPPAEAKAVRPKPSASRSRRSQ